ncbi:hypothetical protein WKE44_25005 [Klebsiella pneumoniae]
MAESTTRRRRGTGAAKKGAEATAENTPAVTTRRKVEPAPAASVDTTELESILEAQEALNPPPEIDIETQELLAAQAQQAEETPAPRKHGSVIHPVGTMDASQFVGEPTILAPRSNASSTTSGRKVKLKGPKNAGDNPIAVISRDGSVYPFSGAVSDRIALLGYDVTYIYDIDDAKMVIAHNEKALREGNADRVIHGIPMEAPALPTKDDANELRENLAVAFSPDMIKG